MIGISDYQRQILSTVLGNASMGFWMIAQIPQLYKNYKRGSVNALSQVFLSIWLIGDITNLIGSILTNQQPFQIRLAAYFVSIDVVMLIQYLHLKSQRSTETEPLIQPDSSLIIPIIVSSLASPVSAQIDTITDNLHKLDYKIGLLFSWICALLYLSSRIPQILLNYNNKSVSGLSISMFICAFMGNLTYSTSLILSDDANAGGSEFWIKSIPFLVGSFGTLCQDLVIFLQSFLYSKKFDNSA